MIVLKFGGTSVQDARAMNQALDIAAAHLSQAPLLVSSAVAGVTNALVSLVEAIQIQDTAAADSVIERLETGHTALLQECARGFLFEDGLRRIEAYFRDIKALVKGSILLNECSPRVHDALLGMGELLSTAILHSLSLQRGIDAQLLDARTLVVTDGHFGEAAVCVDSTRQRIRDGVKAEPGRLLIVQGFIGATEKGVTTILGRGGSDYSASIFGAALDAAEVQIWTDVDGIMTTDPRKVPSALSIPEITYAEAAELAFFGAKVVHPATIQPAVERQIPVLVKNTKNPSHPGTVIRKDAPGLGLRAIAGRKGATLVTVSSSRMLNAYGFLRRIFEIFDRHQLSVDLVATSEVSVSMTLEDKRDLSSLVNDLETLGLVKVETEVAILCLVGQELWKDNRLVTRVFEAIPDLPVRMISLGSSEINLSMVLKASDLDAAVAAIHFAFFGT
jgi:aspartate kinase